MKIISTVCKKITECVERHPEVFYEFGFITPQLGHKMMIRHMDVSKFVDWVNRKATCSVQSVFLFLHHHHSTSFCFLVSAMLCVAADFHTGSLYSLSRPVQRAAMYDTGALYLQPKTSSHFFVNAKAGYQLCCTGSEK